jgi:hypothetical protein
VVPPGAVETVAAVATGAAVLVEVAEVARAPVEAVAAARVALAEVAVVAAPVVAAAALEAPAASRFLPRLVRAREVRFHRDRAALILKTPAVNLIAFLL